MRGEVEGSVGPTIVAKSPPEIDVPKFENKFLDDVAKDLDLFEKVMQQNQYDETVWPLALRTAVVGSKLEALVSMGGTYEIKKEVLLAHGQTADKLWKQLITTTQESESFRQWCVRIATKLVQFIQLTNENKSSSSEDDELSFTKKANSLESFMDTLLKFLIFEGCSKEQNLFS